MNQIGGIVGLLAAGLNPVALLWYQFVQYVPQIIAAIIILVVGWVIAIALGALTRKVVHYTGVDAWVDRAGINKRLRLESGSRYAFLSGMLGSLVKWLIILGAVAVAADAINLQQISELMGAIFSYIPNVIAAIIILVLGIVGAQYASDFVLAGIDASKLPLSNRSMLASIVRYFFITLTVMAALTQLNIVPNLILILFGGLVLAVALAFGLGGRDHARDVIARLREQA